MHVLDSSFLLDYADANQDGHGDAVEFLDANENRPFVAPTLVLYELYRGGVRAGYDADEVASDFDWLEPMPFTESTAREAAEIYASLMDRGKPINSIDVLVAATARETGGTLVTADSDFDDVRNLDVVNYRS